jgi:hypothetical protein
MDAAEQQPPVLASPVGIGDQAAQVEFRFLVLGIVTVDAESPNQHGRLVRGTGRSTEEPNECQADDECGPRKPLGEPRTFTECCERACETATLRATASHRLLAVVANHSDSPIFVRSIRNKP